MFFDYSSLLLAIGFSGIALTITLATAWLTTRSEHFLLTWSIGALLLVAGVTVFSIYSRPGSAQHQLALALFTLLNLDLSIIYGPAYQFRKQRSPLIRILQASSAALLCIAPPYRLGLSGLGTFVANLALGALLFASARDYWRYREMKRFILPSAKGAIASTLARKIRLPEKAM